MRRFGQQLSPAECEEILKAGHTAVLSLQGDDGFPYGVPVNYVCLGGKIYIHGAPEGYRSECVRRDPKLSLAVIAEGKVLPLTYETRYRSVIVRGTGRYIEKDEDKLAILNAMMDRLAVGRLEERAREIQKFSYFALLEVTPVQITGKMAFCVLMERRAKEAQGEA